MFMLLLHIIMRDWMVQKRRFLSACSSVYRKIVNFAAETNKKR